MAPTATTVVPRSTFAPVSVFVVDAEGDLVEHLPGRSVTVARDAAGWPEGPVKIGSSILYLSGGVVHEVGRSGVVFPDASTRGDAMALLPVDRSGGVALHQVWVTSRVGDPAPGEADLLVDVGSTWRVIGREPLAPNEVAVGAYAGRLVTIVLDGQGGDLVERDAISGAVVSRIDRVAGPDPVRQVVSVNRNVIAFVTCARAAACSLVIRTAAQTRLVPPPPGRSFIGGGAMSASGTIAAFAATDDSIGRLLLVDAATGTAREINTDIDIGEPVGAASWTDDGQWLVFGGIRHTFALERGSARPVPLPYAAGYGFIAALEP